MASVDGRHYVRVWVSDSARVRVTPPKPARRNGEKHWSPTPNTTKYVTPPPCRSVQTERSCRRLLVIRRYPFRLNCIVLLSKSRSPCIAYFTVAADWRLIRIVRYCPPADVLTMISDTEILPVAEVRFTYTIYIAQSIVFVQMNTSVTKSTVTNSWIPNL